MPVVVGTYHDPTSETEYSDGNGDRRIDRIRITGDHGGSFDAFDTDFDGRWDIVRESKRGADSSRTPNADDVRKIEEALDIFLRNQLSPGKTETIAQPAKSP